VVIQGGLEGGRTMMGRRIFSWSRGGALRGKKRLYCALNVNKTCAGGGALIIKGNE